VRRILVLQLSRMGDILMTGPLLRGLRREHPSAEISLMVMDSFSTTPLPPRLFDHLVSFPLENLARLLADQSADWAPALAHLREFVDGLGSVPFDFVLNLSHTDTSGLIASLIPAKRHVGFTLRANRSGAIDGGWMTYVRAAARSRELMSFHLVDLFSWAGGVGRDDAGLEVDITPADHQWAERFLVTRGLEGRPLIAMMLGASTEAKRWPAERFAELANALAPHLGEIILVGGSGEQALSSTFLARATRRVFDCTGAASLGELAALLHRSRLLVTNDTGPMHVAVAAGTRVVDISSGPVSAYETGPYGPEHVVVEPELACYPCPVGSECNHFACRSALSAQDAAAVVLFALGERPAPVVTNARVLQGRRCSPSGRIEFVPATGGATLNDLIRVATGRVWERTLDTPVRVAGDCVSADADVALAGASDPVRLAAIQTALAEVVRESQAAAKEVGTLTRVSPVKQRAISLSVQGRFERLLALGEVERAVHALVTFLRYEIGSIDASDLAVVARLQAAAYEATSVRGKLLAEGLAG